MNMGCQDKRIGDLATWIIVSYPLITRRTMAPVPGAIA